MILGRYGGGSNGALYLCGVRGVCGAWMMRGFSLLRVFMRTARGALARRCVLGVLGVFGVFGARVTAHGDLGVLSALRTRRLEWVGEKTDEPPLSYVGYGTYGE